MNPYRKVIDMKCGRQLARFCNEDIPKCKRNQMLKLEAKPLWKFWSLIWEIKLQAPRKNQHTSLGRKRKDHGKDKTNWRYRLLINEKHWLSPLSSDWLSYIPFDSEIFRWTEFHFFFFSHPKTIKLCVSSFIPSGIRTHCIRQWILQFIDAYPVLQTFHVLPHCIFTEPMWDLCYHYLNITTEETTVKNFSVFPEATQPGSGQIGIGGSSLVSLNHLVWFSLYLSFCELRCNDCGVQITVSYVDFYSIWVNFREGMAGSYGRCIFRSMRNIHMILMVGLAYILLLLWM